MAGIPAAPPLWSYAGMDPNPAVPTKPLNGTTSLPALLVWGIVAASAEVQVQGSAAYNGLLARSPLLGITQPCIAYMVNMLALGANYSMGASQRSPAQLQDAMLTTSLAFRRMREATTNGPCNYLPDNCPSFADMATLIPGPLYLLQHVAAVAPAAAVVAAEPIAGSGKD